LSNKIELNNNAMPLHIGIIMDGNGRWAKKRGLPRHFGHQEGMKRVVDIVQAAKELNIKYLTLYAFSTENWKRPKLEVDALMNLLVVFIKNELDRLNKNNVKLNILGDISPLPELPRNQVLKAIEKTKHNDSMTLNIALNYGGRQELVKSFKDILSEVQKGNISIEDLDEKTISNFLYTKDQPDPDLIIRPSGELRLSNFMIYQGAYSELWFSDVLWPDFNKTWLEMAISDYQKRNRRFGGI